MKTIGKIRMTLHFESLLSKIVGLCKQSSERKDSVQWPKNVLSYLEREFRFLPKDMIALQCVTLSRSVGGTRINLVRLCDRAKAYERGIIVKDYHDLDSCPELVLFEGHVSGDGLVHLTKKSDRRLEYAAH